MYRMDMVTWLLRSMGGGECSWIAADVSFAVPRRTWRWAVGGSPQAVGIWDGWGCRRLLVQSVECRYRWLLDRDVGWANVANVWCSLEMVVKGGGGWKIEEGANGRRNIGALLQNHYWGTKWDAQREVGQGRWWVEMVAGTQCRYGCRRGCVSRSFGARGCQEATRCARLIDAGMRVNH